MSLSGKNVIITGATSGFGVQIASVLSSEGASVFIGGRREARGTEVAKETNSTFHVIDVANEASNKQFFAAAEEHFGGQKVDFILLNAGVEGNSEETSVSSLNVRTFDYVYGVNVRGIILGMQYGTPLLRKDGVFVFTSSVASIIPFSGNPIYASSKAAVDGLVRSYAAQFAQSEDERIKSLSVVAINPALYATELSDRFFDGNDDVKNGAAKMLNPSQRVGTAKELAEIVHHLLHGDLPYKSGDVFAADANTHFPLNDYFDRLKAGQQGVEQHA